MDQLSIDEVKNFFSEFVEQYKTEIETNFLNHRDKFALFNSLPAKFDLLFDRDMRYGTVILSRDNGSQPKFSIDASFQDPTIVVAVANSKRYQYNEQGNFLCLFQTNAKRFKTWEVNNFVREFIQHELGKNKIR